MKKTSYHCDICQKQLKDHNAKRSDAIHNIEGIHLVSEVRAASNIKVDITAPRQVKFISIASHDSGHSQKSTWASLPELVCSVACLEQAFSNIVDNVKGNTFAALAGGPDEEEE